MRARSASDGIDVAAPRQRRPLSPAGFTSRAGTSEPIVDDSRLRGSSCGSEFREALTVSRSDESRDHDNCAT